MGLFRRKRVRTEDVTPRSSRPIKEGPAWLPGGVEVPVAGESFHADEIDAVQTSTLPGAPLAAVLVPEPGNPHDPHAVAVYLQGEHVGYLPREVAGRVQPALVAFTSAHQGRLVSCPGEIREHEFGPEIVLWLDPEPLRVRSEAFQIVPDLDAAMERLLARLDKPAPTLTGINGQARAALITVEQMREDVEANYSRDPEEWPRVERAFRRLVGQLAEAHDPFVSTAWFGVGNSTRYQRGRRDDTLHAFIEALYWDRSNSDAWRGLLDMASAAPHAPTLIGLFARVPFEIRPGVLRQLLAMSYGRDRLGRLSATTGEHLRANLLELAESQGDRGSVALLSGEAGLAAEKAGDLDRASWWWRRAIAAGCTDEEVADRFSIWLTKRHEYREAEQVMRQALATGPHSADAAERLRRRLTRCERNLAE